MTDPVLHLLRRATFGPNEALVAQVRSMGTTAWLNQQLNPGSINDSACQAVVRRWPHINMTTAQLWQRYPKQTWDVMYEVAYSHLAQQIWSKRQLQEVMVDFWMNHFVIPIPSGEVWDNAHLWARDVLRKHALGKFSDMLPAAMQHPAMLLTLGNAYSSKSSPNENCGRELLELHTVGLGHYSEADVKQSALALTGLTIDKTRRTYYYNAKAHYVGRLKVMGWSHANTSAAGGRAVAMSYLSYLAHHPATAHRLCYKLARRFVIDNPPASLVDRMARTYLANGTALAPVLRVMFTSPEFAQSEYKKWKRPYEDALSTLRLLNVQPETPSRTNAGGTRAMYTLYWHLQSFGQFPYGWTAPDGYPDIASAWLGAGSTLARWNFHWASAGGWMLPTLKRMDVNTLIHPYGDDRFDASLQPTPHWPWPSNQRQGPTCGSFVDMLARKLLVTGLTTARRNAICAYLGHGPNDVMYASDGGFRWKLYYVVALILDTPNFAYR